MKDAKGFTSFVCFDFPSIGLVPLIYLWNDCTTLAGRPRLPSGFPNQMHDFLPYLVLLDLGKKKPVAGNFVHPRSTKIQMISPVIYHHLAFLGKACALAPRPTLWKAVLVFSCLFLMISFW
jgi:hypothetical protein